MSTFYYVNSLVSVKLNIKNDISKKAMSKSGTTATTRHTSLQYIKTILYLYIVKLKLITLC